MKEAGEAETADNDEPILRVYIIGEVAFVFAFNCRWRAVLV